jgi:putative intracellular protease/amidase
MKQTAYFLIFDGLADWEAALALAEINKNNAAEIITVGFSEAPVTTMGGLQLTPQTTIEEPDIDRASVFIMPGGDRWEAQNSTDEALSDLLHRLHEKGVTIAAICGATLAIGRAGLLKNRRHTSNAKGYLQALLPDYHDEAFYVDELAVSDGGVITASGVGSVEFAREILSALNIYSEEDRRDWFNLFKHAIMPAKYATPE